MLFIPCFLLIPIGTHTPFLPFFSFSFKVTMVSLKFLPIITAIANAIDFPVTVPGENAVFHFNVNPSNTIDFSSKYWMDTKTYSKTKTLSSVINNTTSPSVVPINESDNLEIEFWLAFIGITGTFLIFA